MTRQRVSPMRSHSPSGGVGPNSSDATVEPSTQTGCAMSSSLGGRNRPLPIVQCWIASMGALVPRTVMSRWRERHDTVPAPGTTGVTCRIRGLRLIAMVSSSVSSRAVSPISSP